MEKINVAELLRDCPAGMELDCTMLDNIVFERVDGIPFNKYPIVIRNIKTNKTICLTKYGQFVAEEGYKCVIFPKGKTSWEGFVPPCPFKDGDIVFYDNCVSIFKEWGDETLFRNYVKVDIDGRHPMLCDRTHSNGKGIKREARFATEEEKVKLFDAIKANGYKWNPETKALEKLVEPQFKDGDIVFYDNCVSIFKEWGDETLFRNYVKADIDGRHPMLCDRTHSNGKGIKREARFATEEEKQKLFDTIKERGYRWNPETKTLEKLPEFKDGDVLFVETTNRWIFIYKENENEEDIYKYVAIPDQPNHNYIVHENNPLCCKEDVSKIRFATEKEKQKLFDSIKKHGYRWNPETKTLGNWTIQDAKEGDVLAFNDEIIVIFKDLYNKTSFHSYCHIEDGMFTISKEDIPDWWEGRGFYPATKEQCNLLFQKIKAVGYKWNPETKTLENLFSYNIGKKVWVKSDKEHKYIHTIVGISRNSCGNLEYEVKEEKTGIVVHYPESLLIPVMTEEPKFKVGDTITNGKTSITIGYIDDEYYYEISRNIANRLFIKFQDEWELISSKFPDKFDITTLKPFDKVLVRGGDGQKWTHDFFGFMDKDKGCPFVCVGHYVIQCIPFEGNEHLLGKTDDCNKYFKTWE